MAVVLVRDQHLKLVETVAVATVVMVTAEQYPTPWLVQLTQAAVAVVVHRWLMAQLVVQEL